MRNNQPISGREHPVQPGERLISTTDCNSMITGANDDFIRVAGFSREELIGNPHNIVRHPDMPPAAFEMMWKTLKQGRAWMGVVKNRCKNGDHYIVDAYVTPIYENQQIVGYQSVRTWADAQLVQRASRVYEALSKGNKLSRLSFKHQSMGLKGVGVGLIAALPAAVFGEWLIAALTLGVAGGCALALVRPILDLAKRTQKTFSDPLAQQVYAGRGDEIGQIDVTLRSLEAKTRTIIGRISDAAGSLGDVANEEQGIAAVTRDGVRGQQNGLDMVVTAMAEMSSTVQEVSRHAAATSDASAAALTEASSGDRLVQRAVTDMEALSSAVADASAVIQRLQDEGKKIGAVVDVIAHIASETNLLALNAAIEAARAGDHGRGFAVVAAEVRDLANTTQQSTDQIKAIVESIQASSNQAVNAMRISQQRAETSLSVNLQVRSAFGEINSTIGQISAMNAQVANATEQQTAVVADINRNIVAINDGASSTMDSADRMTNASLHLQGLVSNLRSLVRQFERA